MTWWLFLNISRTYQTLEQEPMFWWRCVLCEAYSFVSPVKINSLLARVQTLVKLTGHVLSDNYLEISLKAKDVICKLLSKALQVILSKPLYEGSHLLRCIFYSLRLKTALNLKLLLPRDALELLNLDIKLTMLSISMVFKRK